MEYRTGRVLFCDHGSALPNNEALKALRPSHFGLDALRTVACNSYGSFAEEIAAIARLRQAKAVAGNEHTLPDAYARYLLGQGFIVLRLPQSNETFVWKQAAMLWGGLFVWDVFPYSVMEGDELVA